MDRKNSISKNIIFDTTMDIKKNMSKELLDKTQPDKPEIPNDKIKDLIKNLKNTLDS